MCSKAIHALALLVLLLPCAVRAQEREAPQSPLSRQNQQGSPTEKSDPLAAAIDQAIDEKLQEAGISASELISDAEYIRRVTLDLAGRIPTATETREFLDASDAAKRAQLVDRLIASLDFAFHQRNELDMLLLAKLQWDSEWRSYLLEAMREHRGLDQIVREILLPEKLRPDDKGAAAFLKQRAKDLDAMTNDTSTLLFGVNIACAKCHDHPLVPDWHQDHYFGFASFFKRTFATRRGFVAERFDGELKFTTTKGEEKRSNFMFLNGKIVEEPRVDRTDEEWSKIREQIKKAEQDDKAEAPPAPSFSPRESLVSLATESRDQPLLARNLSNRLWARLMGQGLVHPLDQMHSGNPPSHPGLLDRLTDELVAHDYDIRPLLRGIALSDAYARSSRLETAGQQPVRELFAARIPRPLTPFQYSMSLWIASRNPDSLPGLDKSEDWNKLREQWEQRAEGFARRFEIPEENYQISVEEALLLSNNPQAQNDYLASQKETLVGHLKSLEDPDKMVDAAYSTILARTPSDQERESISEYLEARRDRSEQACQQLVWVLLTSAEFRFNH